MNLICFEEFKKTDLYDMYVNEIMKPGYIDAKIKEMLDAS